MFTLALMPLAIALAIAAAVAVTHWFFDLPWDLIRTHLRISQRDVAAGFGFLALALAMRAPLVWLGFPEMARRNWTLFQKVVATIVVSFAVGFSIELIF